MLSNLPTGVGVTVVAPGELTSPGAADSTILSPVTDTEHDAGLKEVTVANERTPQPAAPSKEFIGDSGNSKTKKKITLLIFRSFPF